MSIPINKYPSSLYNSQSEEKRRSYVNQKTLLSLSAGIATSGYMLFDKGQECHVFRELGQFFKALSRGTGKAIPTTFADGFKLLQIGEIDMALKSPTHPALSTDFAQALQALRKIQTSAGKKHLATMISKGVNLPQHRVKELLKYDYNFKPLFSKYLKSLSLSDAMKSSSMIKALEKRSQAIQKFAVAKALMVGFVVTLITYDILSLVYKALNRINHGK